MKKKILQVLCLILVVSLGSACSFKSKEQQETSTHYENATQIVQLAEDFVTRFPFRKSGSVANQEAGQWIAQQLTDWGYSVRSEASFVTTVKSGQGFYRTEEQARDAQGNLDEKNQVGSFRKTVVLMAAYDTHLGEENKAEYKDFQGISESGASVATVLTLAKNLAQKDLGYDVQFVFLANSQEQFSAQAYFNQLSEAEKKEIDLVIDIGKIYAGSKLYAHAGQSSALEGHKYELRKNLYHMLDLFALYNFVYEYNMNLFTVQTQLEVNLPFNNQPVLYREFTLQAGNYLPFDKAQIPVVFFEAADYRVEKLEDVKENTSATFEGTSGQVSGTAMDNLNILKEKLSEEQLEKRVDILSRLIELYILNGIYNADINH